MLRGVIGAAFALGLMWPAQACQPGAVEAGVCEGTADCPDGHVCVDERCRRACNSNADCEGSEGCVTGFCLPDPARPDASNVDAAGTDAVGVDRRRDDAAGTDGCVPDCAGRCPGDDNGCGGHCPGMCEAACCSGVCCDLGDTCGPGGTCCNPRSCNDQGADCGELDDQCGQLIHCGACPGNSYCLDHTCASLAMTWQAVSAGDFVMGSPDGELGRDVYSGNPSDSLDESPHPVTLMRSYEIAVTEVTVGDFFTVMGYRPSHYALCGDACAVEWVSWHEAARFCNALSEGRGLDTCFVCAGEDGASSCDWSSNYPDPAACPGYRLPTEAEWERAARGDTQTALSNGDISELDCAPVDATLDAIGWYRGNAAVIYDGGTEAPCGPGTITVGVQPVAQKQANPFGLYDMNGNVWEWVLDCAHSYLMQTSEDPVGPLACADDQRVFRGGGLGSTPPYCRNAERAMNAAEGDRGKDIGFRPVRTLDP